MVVGQGLDGARVRAALRRDALAPDVQAQFGCDDGDDDGDDQRAGFRRAARFVRPPISASADS